MKIKQDPVTGLYCRSDGAVLIPPDGYRFKRFRWTFGYDHGDGYNVVCYKSEYYRIHQIVCRAFHGLAPEGKPVVDHINRIKTDNRPENLHWASIKENNNNKDYVDQSAKRHGIRWCEDRAAYDKAHGKVYYETHREERKTHQRAYHAAHREEHNARQRAYDAAKRAKMKSKGLTFRKGPDGKWGWLPRVHS